MYILIKTMEGEVKEPGNNFVLVLLKIYIYHTLIALIKYKLMAQLKLISSHISLMYTGLRISLKVYMPLGQVSYLFTCHSGFILMIT